MQKLQIELKNVPENASQVLCSTNSQLNKEETLSVVGKVLVCNNPDVNQRQRTGGRKDMVYVISVEGIPLMPCKPAKARKLLRDKKASVAKRYPFTIQLSFECENKTQEVVLSMDSGFREIGLSVITTKMELVSATLILDNKTSKRLTERTMYRRGRRSKLWYRKPRFLNRKRKEGSLSPSIQRRYDAHLRLINIYSSVLPVTKNVIETANFDIQKINNPDIQGRDYQQGDMYGYQNIRSYLMAREKGVCQVCGNKFDKGSPSHIHHVMERSKGGSDTPKNLAILHEKCHIKLHKKGVKLHPPRALKAETFMSIIHKKFYQDVPFLEITYGYITFVDRIKLGLEKTHYNDAFVAGGGTEQERVTPIEIKQKRRNNRSLQLNRNGFKPSIRRQRYPIQPKDIVWIKGEKHTVSGTHCRGTQVVLEKTKKSVAVSKIEKTFNFGSYAYN